MKSALALAALVAFAAAPAVAKDCGARPASPPIPNGKSASEADMKASYTKITTYTKAVNEYLQCLAGETKAATAEAQKVQADYKVAADEWNKAPAKP
ncbi:hypothetical protein [Roseiterribacter gracilis]|uniref:Uncharacterized protein n=1 Tax=Roseiterribacter gracilis TaxID=2812848 RepID=A0A8S8XF54_9PROT|nr:hypothetical protein TMPK1_28060 [Rhodospirillales bacterium TMPK1]